MRSFWEKLLVFTLSLSLFACSSQIDSPKISQEQSSQAFVKQGKITEVSTPDTIQQLHKNLYSLYQPQLSILAPLKDSVLEETSVAVTLEVKNLEIFKNSELQLGPHLKLIVDNQPQIDIYSTEEPIVLENLNSGTHTLRVFAVTPWGESFKNEGSYAETTFHLYSKTKENTSLENQPILTYNQPQGDYGTQPILLDFYLTNAPLHLIARQNNDDDIENWRIKVTINGDSFYLDRWEPIYLSGFEIGKNWIQIEYINEKGESIGNAFNNTVRVINYQPNDDDPLAKLINDKIPLDVVPSIINPKYSKPVPSHDTEEKTSEEIVPASPSDTEEKTSEEIVPASPSDTEEKTSEEIVPALPSDTEEKNSEEIVPASPSDTQIDQVKPISPFFFSAIIE